MPNKKEITLLKIKMAWNKFKYVPWRKPFNANETIKKKKIHKTAFLNRHILWWIYVEIHICPCQYPWLTVNFFPYSDFTDNIPGYICRALANESKYSGELQTNNFFLMLYLKKALSYIARKGMRTMKGPIKKKRIQVWLFF